MDIVKQLTKEVQFIANGKVVQTLQPNVTAQLNDTRNGIQIKDVTGRSIEVFTTQIDTTQLLPAIGIKFQPGNTTDLWDLLFDPTGSIFFNELHIGTSFDPNAIHDNIANEISAITEKIIPVATDILLIEDSAAAFVKKKIQIGNLPTGAGGGAVIETNWTTVAIAAYAVLLTDYQIRVTVLSTLTLPTIAAATIGRVYRIFSRNVKVTINRSAADTINGNTSILLNKWDAVTLRATAAGDWGIGD